MNLDEKKTQATSARSRRQRGFTLWMTGLPASGKSTLAGVLKRKLEDDYDRKVEIFDGDEVRKGLSRDLAFRGRTGKNMRGASLILQRYFQEMK